VEPSSQGIYVVEKRDLDLEAVAKARAILIKETAPVLEIIRRIRSQAEPQIFLKPVFITAYHAPNLPAYLKELLDGEISEPLDLKHFLGQYKDYIDQINSAIQKITRTPARQQNEMNLMLKPIRFMYSRKQNLRPIMAGSSLFGYKYPVIDVNFAEENFQEFEILDYLERNHLIRGKFVDKVHFCNHCHGAFLNFREICTQCHSCHLQMEDVVHHFGCGYIGPESDYVVGNELQCPKCRKMLKHISVDFDRPSVVYECQECQHAFQEPEVDVVCFHCEKRSTPENVIVRDIKEYSLSPLGENSALHGIFFSIEGIFREKLAIVSLETFKTILRLEIERKRRYGHSESSLAFISFANFTELYLKLGAKSQDFINEVAKSMNSFLRTTDVISYINDSTFIFLCTDTPLAGVDIAMKRVEETITTLVRENLGIAIEIQRQALALDGKLSVEQTIEALSAP
jgi:hypothetical protein